MEARRGQSQAILASESDLEFSDRISDQELQQQRCHSQGRKAALASVGLGALLLGALVIVAHTDSYTQVNQGLEYPQQLQELDTDAVDGYVDPTLAGGDPDAGGPGIVLDRQREKNPDEPSSKLMLLDGMAADQPGISESVQKTPTEPWPIQGTDCTNRFQIPAMPQTATDYNGAALPDTCFLGDPGTKDGHHHVFLIGDWGGLPGPFGWNGSMIAPAPADHRSPEFPSHQRDFIWGADDCAQRNVAKWMAKVAKDSNPDYILNVGDNFYWGGINIKCGATPAQTRDATGQWEKVFENVYRGENIDGKQWLGVLGNHDFGGFMFVSGWDQAIHYTFYQGPPSTGRWFTPALYYKAKVLYPDFAIDYYMVDTNAFDTWLSKAEQRHNLCSRNHNPPNKEATCGIVGPISADECPKWFKNLWQSNVAWLDAALPQSTAEWQIINTHFPPEGDWGAQEWARLSAQHGIDLIVAGHRHRQEVHTQSSLSPTTYLVSGGGGGITAENTPDGNGEDDEYGFMDLTLSKGEIMIEAISHGGQIRSTTCITPRQPGAQTLNPPLGPSLCEGRPAGVQPRPTDAPVAPPMTPGVAAPVVGPDGVVQPAAQVPYPAQPGVPGYQPLPVQPPQPASPIGKLQAMLHRVFR